MTNTELKLLPREKGREIIGRGDAAGCTRKPEDTNHVTKQLGVLTIYANRPDRNFRHKYEMI